VCCKRNNMWSIWSSFLIATVAYHAAMQRQHCVGAASLTLFGISVLHHANHTDPERFPFGKLVHAIDVNLGRYIWLHVVWYNITYLNSMIVWLCSIYVPLVYFTILKHIEPWAYDPWNPHISILWHVSMHVVGALASHTVIHAGRMHHHDIKLLSHQHR